MTMHIKKWVFSFLCYSVFLIILTGSANYIVDPYSLTGYNILNIKIKMVSDDRTEKVSAIKNHGGFDNILLGSSRVYLINPRVVSKYIGGSTYNLGVGMAQPEDHLGLLLYLEKLGKFPKNIILGIDFYSFNEGLETNKYFIRNETINFLGNKKSRENDLVQFLSLDMLKASVKTLKVYVGLKEAKQHFDEDGALHNASSVFNYYPENVEEKDIYAIDKASHASDFIYDPLYTQVSEKRLGYLQRIVDMSNRHDSRLLVYITPLYGNLVEDIYNDDNLHERIKEFKSKLSYVTDYYDFFTLNNITRSSTYFGDTSHLKTSTGNLVLARLFNDKTIEIPNGFGVFIKKEEVAP